MNKRPQIVLEYGKHNQQSVVKLWFTRNQLIIDQLKLATSARWSATMKCWYLPQDEFQLNLFFEKMKSHAFIDYSALKAPVVRPSTETKTLLPKKETRHIQLPDGYLDQLEQARYSESTIKTYSLYIKDFIAEFQDRKLDEIGKDDINQYILRLIRENNISNSQQNQRINSIKFYYERVLKKNKEFYQIERPRKERRLPDVLSKEEIGEMLRVTKNVKHKSLIALIYSCGLRRSEVINMKLEDIDSYRMLIKIKGAKGKKDRYVQLANSTLNLLREYYKKARPKNWVFEGLKGKPYSATSIFNTVKNAAKKAGIKKRVYPHILRHSFATHHLEQGTDLRFIQEFLGHESSKTTEIYTHVSKSELSKFKNPIDDIFNSG